MRFQDRKAAGQQLAGELLTYANRPDLLVLALPRGGVPVAFEVAKALNAPLDVFLVRKLGVPGNEELAMGAIASGGVRVLNEDVVREAKLSSLGKSLHLCDATINWVAAQEQQELERREHLYRDDRPAPDVSGRTVILVDDGLATGATMRAALKALRQQQPARLVVAVPISSPETCHKLQDEVDEIICAVTPRPFQSVGFWYDDFSQTTDDEVRKLLQQAANREQLSAARIAEP